jgi:signal transduction histidine kinase
MKSTRVFQLTALILVLISVVQVGWWVFEQSEYTVRKVGETRTLYAQQVAAAQALLDAGVPAQTVTGLLPHLYVDGGQVKLAAATVEALSQEQLSRVNRYLWEGSFFMLALCTSIAVIWMTLRAEARVLKEQDHFLALVSHQFKTPLASLQLSLETMTLRALAPEQSRTLIDRMLSDLARMETMVSRILDSVRLTRGRVDLKREPVQLASAVGRVVSQFDERARGERITISTAIPEDLQVLADPLAVDVVVRNLVENAIAAVAPAGGGTITLESRRLDSEVELAVRDTGVGFRPSDQSRLFEKFSRLDPGGGSTYYGTGLGLFIVKRLMQQVGGRVTARSAGLGQGAEFVLTWPLAAQAS